MNKSLLWLWLNRKVKLNRVKQVKLLDEMKTVDNIYNAGLSEYSQYDFLNESEISNLLEKNLDGLEEEYNAVTKRGARILTIDSDDYPEVLKEIADPPALLYCRGKFIDLNERLCIAIVGTRKATAYGRNSAYNLSKSLASQGVIVVSGMAMGIDTKAHEGAIAAGAPTVAVIGCGVDVVYPKSNAGLMREIINTGMVISEYPLGESPARFHFPERNRIISGLCQGTLVVEADIKSGSLITAKSAYEQGRDVFAVPGNINSMYSKGTNYLLKDGANVVTCDEDVLSVYRYDYADRLMRGISQKEPPYEEDFEYEKPAPEKGTPEDIICKILADEPMHIDSICEKSGLDAGCINSTLLLMELSGKILKLPGGFYEINEQSF